MASARRGPSAPVLALVVLAGCLGAGPPAWQDDSVDEPLVTLAWQNATAAPTARTETTVGTLQGKIYSIGGGKDDFLPGAANDYVGGWANPLRLVEIYDPATDEWTLGPDYPIPIHHSAAVEHGGWLYVLGGMTSSAAQPTALAFRIRTDGSEWEPIASMPGPRAAHVAGEIAGTIYVATGFDNNGLLGPSAFYFVDVSHVPEVWAYDPAANTWRTTDHRIPTPRDHAGAAVVEGRLCVAGGDVEGHARRTAATECYEPGSGTWSKHAPVPTGRGSMGAAAWGGQLVLIGGAERPFEPIANVSAFNLTHNQWSELPPMLVPRYLAKAAVVDGILFSIQGATLQGASAAVERLIPHPEDQSSQRTGGP